jgi:hypothetical protein
MPDRIEGAIVRLLRLGQTINVSREVVNFGEVTDRGENYGRELRRAIGIPLLISQLIDSGLPVVLSWDEKLISVVYTIGGFYKPLVLTQAQNQPLVHGLVDMPFNGDGWNHVMRNSVNSHEEIAALAGTIFLEIHRGRGERVLSTSPWMPYLVRYFPLVEKSTDKDNEYIIKGCDNA